jgi:hypothetical protein
MSRRRLRISERQQVVAAIVGSALVVAALLWFVVWPGIRERRTVERDLQALSRGAFASMSKDELEARVEEVQENLGRVRQEWRRTRERLNTYSPKEGLLGVDDVQLIDFKVELLKERDRLRGRSAELEIELIPKDLGMSEALRTGGEPAKVLMLKLRAIEKLADLALAHKIDRLVAVRPLSVVRHRAPRVRGGEFIYMEEYPIRVEFDMTLETLYDFFHAVFEESNVFVFKRLRVNAGQNEALPLRVEAVLSAIMLYDEPKASESGSGKGGA